MIMVIVLLSMCGMMSLQAMELQILERRDSSFSKFMHLCEIIMQQQSIVDEFLKKNESKVKEIKVLCSSKPDYLLKYYASMQEMLDNKVEIQKGEGNNAVRSQLGYFENDSSLKKLLKEYQKMNEHATQAAQIQLFLQSRMPQPDSNQESKALVLWVDPKKTQSAALVVRVTTPLVLQPIHEYPSRVEFLDGNSTEVNLFDISEAMPTILEYHPISSLNDTYELSNALCLIQ